MKQKSKLRNPGSEGNLKPGLGQTGGLSAGASRGSSLASWKRSWLPGLFLAVAVVIVYWPALHGTFLWDDDMHFAADRGLRTWKGLWDIWFKPGAAPQYYPLTWTGFWIAYHLWGLNPLGYHLLNVFLHALTAILLWRVLARLKVKGAWLAGALFALHPVCVMSVAWMTELKNTLSAPLALGAAWAYLRFARLGVCEAEKEANIEHRTPNAERRTFQTAPKARSGFHSMFDVRRSMFDVVPSRWWFYALSLVLFQLALFAKSAVSFVPVSLLLVTWWRRARLRWRDAGPLLPMLAQAWAMGRMTSYVEQLTGATGHQFHLGFLERVLISGRSFWFYLGKLFYPHRLTFIYERWHLDPHVGWQYLYPLATAAALAGLWFGRRWIGKGWFAAFMHFYICTSLLILFLVLFMTRYTFVSDHWQYFGCMSVMAMAAAGITAALGRFERRIPLLKPILCGPLLFVLGALSWRQCGMYTDPETLWRTTLARNPRCFLAHNCLGNLLLQKGRADEALDHYQKAVEIEPDFVDAQFNIANVLYEKGQVDEAIVYYRKALEERPGFAEIHNNLGNALLQKGQLDEALFHYQKALEDQPDWAEIHNNIGNVLLQKGRADEAIPHFLDALEIQPGYADAHYNLGNVFLQKGRLDEAIAHFRKALESQPDSAKVLNNLGNALLLKGQVADAVAHYRSSLKLQPDNIDVLSNLAWVLATWPEASVRNGAQAGELAERANRLTAGRDPAVLHVLAAAYAEEGRFTEAVTTAQQAWQLATNQNNIALGDALQSQLKCYQSGAPFRDISLTNGVGNAGNF